MTQTMKVRRATIQDVFSADGRCAVFINGHVVVLSEIATCILESVPTEAPITLEEITTAVVAEFGTPEPPLDALELTKVHLLELVAHRVLVDADVFHHAATPASVTAAREAVRHLCNDAADPWRLPDDVRNQFVEAVRRQRLGPALAQHPERLDLPPAIAAQLRADQSTENAAVRSQATELQQTFEALERAGVRALAFKGLALAVQAHGDYTARGRGDHDILVDPGDLARAHAAITALGWIPGEGFARPGESWAWRHLVRNYYELTLTRGGQSVDLHWHLGPVRAAFPSFTELWSRRVEVEIGGQAIPTLSAYDALAHSATHAAKDQWDSLRSLLDIHRLCADPQTWRQADRKLNRDQLLSIAIATQLFGIPTGAPPIVTSAARPAAAILPAVLERQSNPQAGEIARRVPGSALLGVLAGLHRAGAGPSDYRRYLKVLVLPITDYTGDPTRSAALAVPRILARRSTEIARLWRGALQRRRPTGAKRSRADKTDT